VKKNISEYCPMGKNEGKKMNNKTQVYLIFLLLLPLTGCLDSNEKSMEVIFVEEIISEDVDGYVAEGETDIIQIITLNADSILTGFVVVVTWEDEPDITSNARSYKNEPDIIQVYMIDDNGWTESGYGENPYGGVGEIIVDYPMDSFDNNRLEGSRNITIEVEVMFANDQKTNIGGPIFGTIDDAGNSVHCNSTWKLLRPKDR
jgi:hypothetical protein